jgi:hypothetical protein
MEEDYVNAKLEGSTESEIENMGDLIRDTLQRTRKTKKPIERRGRHLRQNSRGKRNTDSSVKASDRHLVSFVFLLRTHSFNFTEF